MTFEQAFSTAPWTLPSHASMFTGRWHHEQSSSWLVPLDSTFPTLAEVLGAHGYTTAGFVANLDYCTYELGLSRGFSHYEDYPLTPWDILLNSSLLGWIANDLNIRRIVNNYELVGRKSAEQVNQEFLSWISGDHQRPFFAFLNYFDAHDPYLPPSPFDTIFGPNHPRKDPRLSQDVPWAQEDIQVEERAYEGSIAYIDHQLGALYAELEQRGLSKNTLIIIVSDHGEQFGEHIFDDTTRDASGQTRNVERYLLGHENSLYVQSLHVPLLILFPPGAPAGQSIDRPTSLRNLPATVLDLIGLGESFRFPGFSLSRYWQSSGDRLSFPQETILSELNTNNTTEWAPSAKGNMKSLVTEHYHYILNGDRSEEIYDYQRDKQEAHNLVGFEEGRRLLSQFRAQLASCGAIAATFATKDAWNRNE